LVELNKGPRIKERKAGGMGRSREWRQELRKGKRAIPGSQKERKEIGGYSWRGVGVGGHYLRKGRGRRVETEEGR